MECFGQGVYIDSKKSDHIWAGVLIFSYPQLIKLEERWVEGKSDFPYIPGL
jgi:deoxyinosine 3'endonuclease (endonuclease V)